MPADLVSAKREAEEQRDELFKKGKQLEKDWVDFYLSLALFQSAVRIGRRKYELAGYDTWEDFLTELTAKIGESRSELLAKLGAVRLLPESTVRELGKTRIFQAVRLVRAGKWNDGWKGKLVEMTVEEGKLAVAKAVGTNGNGHFRLIEVLRTGQEDLWLSEKERIKELLALDTNEAFWDFLLGHLHNLSDGEITGRPPCKDSK